MDVMRYNAALGELQMLQRGVQRGGSGVACFGVAASGRKLSVYVELEDGRVFRRALFRAAPPAEADKMLARVRSYLGGRTRNSAVSSPAAGFSSRNGVVVHPKGESGLEAK